ncbi:hypothetical protein [Terrabacter sp. Ter38]|uniref:hypothetical protein n=1 Tax=Terrabacter sp. Ter38 TaxID=2926030 RepID=UPI0021197C5E|nr:hypothetical protein [Terrabacter sp. Ter38]
MFAQNRYDPVGAAIRAVPLPGGQKVGGFSPNELVTVDGWTETQPAYPRNRAPWNSDIWFHLADGKGWVSFAGLRQAPTAKDDNNHSLEGGPPVPATESCRGVLRMPAL